MLSPHKTLNGVEFFFFHLIIVVLSIWHVSVWVLTHFYWDCLSNVVFSGKDDMAATYPWWFCTHIMLAAGTLTHCTK